MGSLTVHPHDLTEVAAAAALVIDDGTVAADARAAATVSATVWAVARRAPRRAGLIAVGIRGSTRSQRFAAYVHPEAVLRVVRPWEATTDPAPARTDLPAIRALRHLRHHFANQPGACRWGPGGSVGFELVTGAAVVTESSDLDIVLDAPEPLPPAAAHAWHAAIADSPTRVDVQVSTPLGGFALTEWLREDGGPVALRTATGPVLTARPWG